VAEHLGVDEAEEELLHLAAGHVGVGERRLRCSSSRAMMRSSSALERASPMDLTRSRNSLDCPHPPWDPIASSRPIVRSCSIAPVGVLLLGGTRGVWSPQATAAEESWRGVRVSEVEIWIGQAGRAEEPTVGGGEVGLGDRD
jgi:hypothetical protein